MGEGAPCEFEAATVAEDDGEGVGWGGELVGGAEGGAGLAAGLVGGEELLDLGGGAAVNAGFGHHPTKSDLNCNGNHGVGRSEGIN